jgi:hypothetical protein
MARKESNIKSSKALTEDDQIKGRGIILVQMTANHPTYAAQWKQIFSDDNPARVLPSEDMPGKIAYSADPENPKRRTRTSLGRFLIRNCDIPDSGRLTMAVSRAMAAVTELYPIEDQFEILTGKAIETAYRNNVGSSSCMAGGQGQGRMGWYVDNPDKVGLLVWRKTQGRALLWTCDDGRRFLDRIYAGDIDAAVRAYKGYAAAHDITMGHSFGRPAKDCVVTLQQNGTKPYLDSFQPHGARLLAGCVGCGDCGLPHPSYELEKQDGRQVCAKCATQYKPCPCCDKKMKASGSACQTMDGKHICGECAKDGRKWKLCVYCGKYARPKDAREGKSGAQYCVNCIREVAQTIKKPELAQA